MGCNSSSIAQATTAVEEANETALALNSSPTLTKTPLPSTHTAVPSAQTPVTPTKTPPSIPTETPTNVSEDIVNFTQLEVESLNIALSYPETWEAEINENLDFVYLVDRTNISETDSSDDGMNIMVISSEVARSGPPELLLLLIEKASPELEDEIERFDRDDHLVTFLEYSEMPPDSDRDIVIFSSVIMRGKRYVYIRSNASIADADYLRPIFMNIVDSIQIIEE